MKELSEIESLKEENKLLKDEIKRLKLNIETALVNLDLRAYGREFELGELQQIINFTRDLLESDTPKETLQTVLEWTKE